MKSVVCTRAARPLLVRAASPMTPTERTGKNTANACAMLSYQLAVGIACGAELVDEDRVGAAQRSAHSRRTSPRIRTPSPGPGNGWRNDLFARQAHLKAELAHFVLEELAQRLEQRQMQCLGQPADIVMRLDRVRLVAFRGGRLDDVGIDRALREPADLAQLRRFALEHVDEQPTDDLALALRDRRRRRAPSRNSSVAST